MVRCRNRPKIGYGPELNISGSVLGLGDHDICLCQRRIGRHLHHDVCEEITIFDQVDVDASPLFTSTAITEDSAWWSYELPHQGKDYTVGGGKTPLALNVLNSSCMALRITLQTLAWIGWRLIWFYRLFYQQMLTMKLLI